jgi:hypothetical protein
MNESATRTNLTRSPSDDSGAVVPQSDFDVSPSCPPWCTTEPHSEEYSMAWHDGEATLLHEAYLLRDDDAEVVIEQLVQVSAAGMTDRSAPASLYVRIDHAITSDGAAGRIAAALAAAAHLIEEVASSITNSERSRPVPSS